MLTKKRKAADQRLRREFGISLTDYELILCFQRKRCAICKKLASSFKTRLAVDHCHTTGLVRGLLCNWCNRAIAKFHDNAERVMNAYTYLTAPTATDALGRVHLTAPGRVGTKRRAKLLKLMNQKSNEGAK